MRIFVLQCKHDYATPTTGLPHNYDYSNHTSPTADYSSKYGAGGRLYPSLEFSYNHANNFPNCELSRRKFSMGQIECDVFLFPSLDASHDYDDAKGHAFPSLEHYHNYASNFPDCELSERKFSMGQIGCDIFLIFRSNG